MRMKMPELSSGRVSLKTTRSWQSPNCSFAYQSKPMPPWVTSALSSRRSSPGPTISQPSFEVPSKMERQEPARAGEGSMRIGLLKGRRNRPGRFVQPRQLQEQHFEPRVVFRLVEASLEFAKLRDGQFQLIAPSARCRGEGEFAPAPDEVKLVRAQAIGHRAGLRPFHGADTAEPVGGRAEAVAIVVDQGVLGREPSLARVKLGGAPRRAEERLQERGLSVLVQVSFRVGDGFGQEPAQAGVIHLVAAASGGNDYAVRA